MSNNIKNHNISAIRDTLSSRHHSKDFIFARSEYLRARIKTISLLFVVLTPFWALFDWFLLPAESRHIVFPARVLLFLSLTLILFISQKPNSSAQKSFFLSGMTMILPGLFYAVILMSLANSIPHSLIGYSFIPFLLVVTLGIFPLTLIESLMIGSGLLLLQLFSGFIMGEPFDAQNLQNLWLLAALLSIVMTTNHFHLSLLLRLYRQATHDPLTGLLNRSALMRHTKHIEQLEQRPSTAIILLDLDHFKLINDTHGHSIGDTVLRLFSSMLKDTAQKNEIICRYGGEEFLIISTDISKQEALQYAETIRQLTQTLQPHSLDGIPFKISVSQGLSMLRPKEDIHSAIQRADERLYAAKRNGRNRVVGNDLPA